MDTPNNTKSIFLDRDGVINKDPDGGYITTWAQFEFLPGALEAIRELTRADYDIYVISNQAGIGKGIYNLEALKDITRNMTDEIKSSGGKIKGVFYCPHRREDNCDCRKPRVGLFRQASRTANIQFNQTYFIGDSKEDVEAGKAIGCKTILVLSGRTKSGEVDRWDVKPDIVAADLRQAVAIIFDKDKR